MATDFWASSHYKRWIVDRATLRHARSEDIEYVDDPDHLDFLAIFFANVITKLGKKLGLRQRVIATATVFFRRFYLKNAYCETDPFYVIPACVYVAAKAEESSVHIKNVISESKSLFSQTYGIKSFPSDNSKLAEMEFYLVDDLECDMVVYHPYKTLLALCKKDMSSASASTSTSSVFGGSNEEGEEGEAEEDSGMPGTGIGSEDGARYWGTGQGQLVLSESALQAAWSIINDTYRSELCLLYPPHLIAIAALYLTFTLHPPEKTAHRPSTQEDQKSQPQPRRSSRQASNNSSNINFSTLATVGHSTSSSFPSASSLSKFKPPPSLPAKPVTSYANLPPTIAPNIPSTSTSSGSSSAPISNPDPISFLASLNVSLPLIATITQEIISLYALWDRYKEDGTPESTHGISITALSTPTRSNSFDVSTGSGKGKGKNRSSSSTKSGIPIQDSTMSSIDSLAASPASQSGAASPAAPPSQAAITPAFLLQILASMREARFLDLGLGGEGELLGLSASAASAAAIAGHSSIGQGAGGYGHGEAGLGIGYGYPPVNKMLERAMNAGYG
ncbi:hypothetical protein D9611_003057 [Ephemerocybe angulata]|uniref:Cyclin-like domain-containing protein n=1 Tax=Ephemerocybe angulata TaxID=980116 RepID=A0A8H5C8M1_9AGAR|nr:hypothetical protein D9611_003057 [Tulosesus angulatus]